MRSERSEKWRERLRLRHWFLLIQYLGTVAFFSFPYPQLTGLWDRFITTWDLAAYLFALIACNAVFCATVELMQRYYDRKYRDQEADADGKI